MQIFFYNRDTICKVCISYFKIASTGPENILFDYKLSVQIFFNHHMFVFQDRNRTKDKITFTY